MTDRRTITVTLSRKEWDTIVAAVAYYETVLEDFGHNPDTLQTAFSPLNNQWAQAPTH